MSMKKLCIFNCDILQCLQAVCKFSLDYLCLIIYSFKLVLFCFN